MLKKFLPVVLAILVALPVAAAQPELRPGHPGKYTVQRGDTLWDIAGRFLSRPWHWPQIWKANPQVRNPDLIYPGDVLVLTYVDGQPVITLEAGEVHLGGRNYKRSPVVREYLRDDAVPPIPLDAIRQFLERPAVVGEGVLDRAPYVVSSEDERLVAGAGNRIYVRGLPAELETSRYTVFRSGEVYRDPGARADEVLGYEALYVGDAVIERGGDPATALLLNTKREVLVGDRLLPQTEEEYPQFIPSAPEAAVDGHIISIVDGVSQVGQYQVVVLNRGASDGLQPGHVLAVYQSGKTVRDTVAPGTRSETVTPTQFEHSDTNTVDRLLENVFTDVRQTKRDLDRALGIESGFDVEEVVLPEERTGELMVFRSFDNVSYGLILRSTRPVHLHDVIRNP